MARVVYFMNCSFDGYVEDPTGAFGWSAPDAEAHRFINDVVRPVGTYLYGRRMYEVMRAWEQPEVAEGEPAHIQEFAAIWRAADKVVYSTTLDAASTQRTRIETTFEPQAIHRLKDASESDLAVAGPDLAGQFMRAGLIDEYLFLLAPIIVGGGKPALPDGFRTELELVDERRFPNGAVFVRYRSPG